MGVPSDSRSIIVERYLSPEGLRGRSRICWDEAGIITDILKIDKPSAYYLAAPGLIDSHFHGFAGVGLQDGVPSPEEWLRMDADLLAHGVTSYVIGVCTGSPEHISKLADSAGAASPQGLVGLYCEGPFLNPECAGALPREQLRTADPGLCREILSAARGLVLVMVVSPELSGVCELIELLRERHVIPAMGHSCADFRKVRDAVDAGAMRATHWPNAMRWGDHHDPGIAQAVLTDDRVFLEVIGDGAHLHPLTMDIAARCKGNRLVCISDCMPVTGTDCNAKAFYAHGLEMRGGRLVLAGTDVHAGGSVPFDECLRNLYAVYNMPMGRAHAACSTDVAASLGLSDRGKLAVGMRADLLLVGEDSRTQSAYRKGVREWIRSTS